MHVELIVRLPGLYDDKIIYFFPAGGLPQGNILPFSSSTVWNDVHICSMSVWIWAAVRLIFTHTHTHAWRLAYLEMISRTLGNVAKPTPRFWHWEAAPCPPHTSLHNPPPLSPVSGASNASPDPYQSTGSTTCWSKSSIDLKQLCAVEHYILIRVAWWL